jgi:hypothetical protein
MAVTESTTTTAQLSPLTIVAVRSDALTLPTIDGALALPLGPDELEVLSALAGTGRFEATTPEHHAFLTALDERHLLLPPTTTTRSLVVGPEPTPPAVALPPDDVELFATTPAILAVTPRGFAALDHDGGTVAVLSTVELLVLAGYRAPATRPAALALTEAVLGARAFDEATHDRATARLLGTGLLRLSGTEGRMGQALREKKSNDMRAAVIKNMQLRAAVDRRLAELHEAERAREARTGVTRTKIIPIHNQGSSPPLSLGMIFAYVDAFEGGRLTERYLPWPDWVAPRRSADELTAEPAIFLFTDYLWSHGQNLEISKAVKERSPGSLTIHGGPDCPSYEADVEEYFAANPHVDVAVHGEGEVTTAELLAALPDGVPGDAPLDLRPLAGVPGLSFRDGDRVVHTGRRERLSDLDVLPSPYLTGVFDAYREVPEISVTLETNRGCPYGCTYCDWGSNINARIRKFDLDRVLGELEWCAVNHVQGIGLADANFGIFERDVDIAARVVELKAEHGYPKACTGSYAKNTVKHLEKIIRGWIDGGIVTLGVLSLQTMDPDTLDAVRRSNIKTEKYDQLAREFRRNDLPLYVDLMMGLPGQTFGSFVDDLQACIDREVQAKIHETALLVNSPMNEPAYRETHGIQIRRPGAAGTVTPDALVIVQTNSMSRQDFEDMRRLRRMYLFCENFGVLRHVSRFVRHETGVREVDVYERLRRAATEEPWRWPAGAYLVDMIHDLMCAPVSWRPFVEEVGEFVRTEIGVPDSSALRTVLDVQHALLPSTGRHYPATIELEHDYAAWHAEVLAAKFSTEDWPSEVAPLSTFGPATFTVDDPWSLSDHMLGGNLEGAWFDTWDLDSPVARPGPLSRSKLDPDELWS